MKIIMKIFSGALIAVFMSGCGTNRPQVGIFKEDNENQTFENAPRIIDGSYIERCNGEVVRFK